MNGRRVLTRQHCTAAPRRVGRATRIYGAFSRVVRRPAVTWEIAGSYPARHPTYPMGRMGRQASAKRPRAGSVPAWDSKGTIDTEGRDSDLAGPISRLYRGSTGLRHHGTVIPRRPSVRRRLGALITWARVASHGRCGSGQSPERNRRKRMTLRAYGWCPRPAATCPGTILTRRGAAAARRPHKPEDTSANLVAATIA